jgi:succinoglycan biosynthesis transport protein ExoP
VEFGQVARALRSGWLFVLLFVVLGLGASVLYLRLAPVTYTARADVYVSTVGGLNVSELNSGSNFAEQQARNLSLIATRERVLQPVVRQLRLPDSTASLGRAMTATVPTNSSMILLEVSNSSPSQAALIANAVSTSLINTTADLLPPAKKGAPALRVQVVQPAVVPSEPAQPSRRTTVLVGLAAGLLVGLAVALGLQARRERRLAASRPSSPATERAAAPGAAAAPGQHGNSWSWEAGKS